MARSDAGFTSLLRELQTARHQPVFHTWVYASAGVRKAVICTTNERVHLALGKLSEHALRSLVKLFEEKTRVSDQLVFTFESEEGETKPRSLFITASEDEGQARVFHVAPGH